MSTAVVLLAVLAVASLAGTFLEQGLPREEYLLRYGDFWVRVFEVLGLFNVYAAPWFLVLGGLLAVSVACCLASNGRLIAGMIRRPARPPLAGVLGGWPLTRRYPQSALPQVEAALAGAGFGAVWSEGESRFYRKGVANRWGYFFTHIGVLVLCAAGLVSGFGGWRGITNLADGESYAATWLRVDGEMVNKSLPFTLRNDGFGIDFYDTGMPKAFYTDLTVLENGTPVRQERIEVNKPLFHKGYAVYQASFGDAGSEIVFRLRRLREDAALSAAVTAHVRDTVRNDLTGYQIELVDFRPHTVESVFTTQGQRTPTFMDVGPSVDYILRVPDKAPLQLRAYMTYPNIVGLGDGEGRYTPALLGLNPAENTPGWPMLADLRRLYAEGRTDTLEMMKTVAAAHLTGLPEEQRFGLAAGVLQTAQVLEQTDLPAVLVLDSFDQRLYTGLQVAYDPGADLFWVGSLMLVLGATLMTLTGYGRVWILPEPKGGTLLVAAQSRRAAVLTALEEALPPEQRKKQTDAA
jgi:cytochrome c biogenesis protein